MMEFPLNKLYFTLMLLFYALAPHIHAEALKIGFVNAMKVMEQAPQVESANKRLEQEFAPRQRAIVTAQKQIRELEERLSKNVDIMSEAETRRLSRDLRDKKREFKHQQEEFREDYNIRRSEELDKLQKKIIEVIQAIAKEQAYDVILSDGGVVWAGNRVDITDKVLQRLNQQQNNR